jgi:hypothetical protein
MTAAMQNALRDWGGSERSEEGGERVARDDEKKKLRIQEK